MVILRQIALALGSMPVSSTVVSCVGTDQEVTLLVYILPKNVLVVLIIS